MNRFKKILSIILITLVVFLAGLIAIPYFFKDEIVEGIRQAADDQLTATLDFDDISLSLIRSFPELQIDLENASLIGEGEFEGLPLYQAQRTSVNLDLLSVFDKKRTGTITSAEFDNPKIYIRVNDAGEANYNIVAAQDQTTQVTESEYELDLTSATINNGQFIYEDIGAGIFNSLENVNITAEAQLRGSKYDIGYKGEIGSSNLKVGGISYLKNAIAEIKGIASLDIESSKYEFTDTELVLNELDLAVEGWIQNLESSVLMDLNFESADDEFRKLWSLVPGVYTEEFKTAQIAGLMGVEGFVRGTYDARKEQLPAFDIRIKTNGGSIGHPGIPKKITGINSDITISSPGALNFLSINIPGFSFDIDGSPFEGRFLAEQIQTNPSIDMRLDGTIDLEDFDEIVKLDGLQTMRGKIISDIQVKGRLSDINNANYQNTLISGMATVTDLVIQREDQPSLEIDQLSADFSPEKLTLSNVIGRLGKTAFNTDLAIDNVIALLSPTQKVTGKVTWKSDIIDFNDWMSSSVVGIEEDLALETTSNPLPVNFELDIQAHSDLIKYTDYDLKNVTLNAQMVGGDIQLKQLSSTLGASDLSFSGKLNNVLDFVLNEEMLTGEIDLVSDYLDLNQFMLADEAAASSISTEENYAPIVIPENIDLSINAKINKVDYDNLSIEKIDGILNIANSEARMKNVKAQAFDGQFLINGGYTSLPGEQPQFDLEYAIQQFDFEKTFDKVNTFRFLAPIAKFIKGNFNSTLKMSGGLTEDLLPDLSSINADGFVETFNGLLADFKPLDLIGQYFNTDKIQKMSLSDTKNYFTVENGTVSIKEFEQNIDDIGMRISGTHGLDQQINYLIKAQIPKAKLAKTGVTDVVDLGLSKINTQLNRLGFNINQGSFINLNFMLTGTITQPKLEVRVVGMDGETDMTDVVKSEIKEAVETVKDSIKTAVNEKIDSTTAVVDSMRNVAVDSASALVNQQLDSAKANIQKEMDKLIKEHADGVIPDSLKTQIDSLLLKGGGKEVEKAKEILKTFNPFKKKKKKTSGG